MKPSIVNLLWFLAFSLLSAESASGQGINWAISDIQLLYGNDFEFGDDERSTLTVEHAHGWQYGTNFFFVDLLDRNDIGFEAYAEVYSYLSMNKITSCQWSAGPVKDVSLVAGLNISNKPENDGYKAYLFGLSLDLSNERFDYLQLDVAAYKADDVGGKYGVQITPVWSLPFEVASLKFKFRGFTDFRTGSTNASGNFNILAQPQILLDVGYLAGWRNDKIYVGTEYSLWYNKFGVNGVNESVVQAMIIGFF